MKIETSEKINNKRKKVKSTFFFERTNVQKFLGVAPSFTWSYTTMIFILSPLFTNKILENEVNFNSLLLVLPQFDRTFG